ncbi:conserved hypothetical protein [Xenorhabdus nematophila F1]|uniref:Uncharacterized protein n=1 Tax=Xenorhabdus nematophila (strain ATCC 19061 / DSM 3370 / CCUG 14189 / LMG 1036 / NCIMB 9965 / AN6) TaxID=406817 RepID=D3VIF9_XENNA|nr:hypothetical protein XNC1_2745 [Xenorhabdus nematophila ATCC 19061]CCW29297.1 conserved hypothetical protein [Xenorhabdus nematophila F1]CEK23637.1 hypothetical protein XNC2_2643 [Xenorhabdus nematophila AN6/1]
MVCSNGYYYVSNRGLYNFEPSNNWIQCGKLIEELITQLI